jgi:hypothetical protein
MGTHQPGSTSGMPGASSGADKPTNIFTLDAQTEMEHLGGGNVRVKKGGETFMGKELADGSIELADGRIIRGA